MSQTRGCEVCGEPLVRRTHPGGQLESVAMFSKRRFCSAECRVTGLALVPPELLVAKTCLQCHRLVEGGRFRISNGRRASRCRECMAANDRANAEFKVRRAAAMRERAQRAAEETRPTAERHGARWTTEDERVLLDGSLSVTEKARTLGRTYRATLIGISEARQGCLVKEPPALPHGTAEGYSHWRCRCDACTEAANEKARVEYARTQRESLGGARRRYRVWTGAELELLATRVAPDDLTIAQVAEMLGRTFAATTLMRWKVQHDPKYMKAAGVIDA